MLFATLDPTTRRIRLPRSSGGSSTSNSASTGAGAGAGGSSDTDGDNDGMVLDANVAGARNKGQEVLLTDHLLTRTLQYLIPSYIILISLFYPDSS